MYQRICRRAHLGIQDAAIMPIREAPTVEPGMPDEQKMSRLEAKRLNSERWNMAKANLLWVQTIPTLLGIRELIAEADRRDKREAGWILLWEQIRDNKKITRPATTHSKGNHRQDTQEIYPMANKRWIRARKQSGTLMTTRRGDVLRDNTQTKGQQSHYR
jgi:hypothetical protein